jgi:hypothetical protein
MILRKPSSICSVRDGARESAIRKAPASISPAAVQSGSLTKAVDALAAFLMPYPAEALKLGHAEEAGSQAR